MDTRVVINTQALLLEAIAEQIPFILARGEYELDIRENQFLDVCGAHPLFTVIHLKRTLNVAHWSIVSRLTLRPPGDKPAVCVDFGAYATFDTVTFESDLPVQSHLGKLKWDLFQHKGVGIIVTDRSGLVTDDKNIDDNTYGVTVSHCHFKSLRVGIDIGLPFAKGTVAWTLWNNVYNSTRHAVIGQRIGEWKMNDRDVQLAEVGYLINGNGNVITSHFERNGTDIHVARGSVGNHIWSDAERVVDEGIGTKRRRILSPNIGRKVV